MEIVLVFAFLWLVGALFPSSGASYGPSGREVLAFAACAAFAISLFFAYFYAMAGIMYVGEWLQLEGGARDAWLALALFGPIAGPMIVASVVNAIKEKRNRSEA